jgi:hypothetical protein
MIKALIEPTWRKYCVTCRQGHQVPQGLQVVKGLQDLLVIKDLQVIKGLLQTILAATVAPVKHREILDVDVGATEERGFRKLHRTTARVTNEEATILIPHHRHLLRNRLPSRLSIMKRFE